VQAGRTDESHGRVCTSNGASTHDPKESEQPNR
jgi:hypothetical protein